MVLDPRVFLVLKVTAEASAHRVHLECLVCQELVVTDNQDHPGHGDIPEIPDTLVTQARRVTRVRSCNTVIINTLMRLLVSNTSNMPKAGPVNVHVGM